MAYARVHKIRMRDASNSDSESTGLSLVYIMPGVDEHERLIAILNSSSPFRHATAIPFASCDPPQLLDYYRPPAVQMQSSDLIHHVILKSVYITAMWLMATI